MQEVLRSVSRSANRLDYDPSRGTFRGWLFTVTRNKVFNFLESRSRRVVGSGRLARAAKIGTTCRR